MDFGVFYELIFEVFNLKLENYFDAACWPTFTPATMFECYFLRLPVRATLSALPNFPTFRNGPHPPPPRVTLPGIEQALPKASGNFVPRSKGS